MKDIVAGKGIPPLEGESSSDGNKKETRATDGLMKMTFTHDEQSESKKH